MDVSEPQHEGPADDGLSAGQRQIVHDLLMRPANGPRPDLLGRSRWRAEHELDTAKIEREGEAATTYWVKPLWWTLGAGLTGLALFVGQIWFVPLAKALGLQWGDAIAWLRFAAMLVGGFLLVVAWPAQITRDRVPDDPNDPPLPADHEPLKTKWFE